MIALLASFAVLQAASVASHGVYCSLFELDGSGQVPAGSKVLPLSFLMSGHMDDPNGRTILRVFDPSGLLNGTKFDSVFFDQSIGGGTYAVTAPVSSTSAGYLLMMKPRESRGEFDATFGGRDQTRRKIYRGRCFGPVGPMDEAAFDAENK